MLYNHFFNFLGSQLFANLLLLLTVVVALIIGLRQVALNDVIEIYATPNSKEVLNPSTGQATNSPIISLQNAGTRLIYLDKYTFNGSEYSTNGQPLPANGIYWIDLPTNGVAHVSVSLYYHDLDERKWKSDITADMVNGSWLVSSLPRTEQ